MCWCAGQSLYVDNRTTTALIVCILSRRTTIAPYLGLLSQECLPIYSNIPYFRLFNWFLFTILFSSIVSSPKNHHFRSTIHFTHSYLSLQYEENTKCPHIVSCLFYSNNPLSPPIQAISFYPYILNVTHHLRRIKAIAK